MLSNRLRGMVSSRLHALLPRTCALCGMASGDDLCGGCTAQYFARSTRRCPQCAINLPPSAAICGECLRHPLAFDATIAAVDYAPPLDQLVLALKFGNRLPLAPLFARLLAGAAADAPHGLPEELTAVPLGPRRLSERGFNQAMEIARPLGRRLGVPVTQGLVSRTRDTSAQSTLPPDERRRNMRSAFMVPPAAMPQVRGRHIGVVDDVATTGETLNEVAATLKRFGAARVTCFVFARTPQK